MRLYLTLNETVYQIAVIEIEVTAVDIVSHNFEFRVVADGLYRLTLSLQPVNFPIIMGGLLAAIPSCLNFMRQNFISRIYQEHVWCFFLSKIIYKGSSRDGRPL